MMSRKKTSSLCIAAEQLIVKSMSVVHQPTPTLGLEVLGDHTPESPFPEAPHVPPCTDLSSGNSGEISAHTACVLSSGDILAKFF